MAHLGTPCLAEVGPLSSRVRLALLLALASLAGALLIGLVLVFFAQPSHRLRWDLSQHSRQTLSERTTRALASLPVGSKITGFFFLEEERLLKNGSAVYPQAYSRLRTLLEDARIQTGGNLAVLQLDDTADMIQVETEAVRLQREPGEVLFLESQGKVQRFSFQDLFVTTGPTADGTPARIRQEQVDMTLGNAATLLAQKHLPSAWILQDPTVPVSQDFLPFLEGQGLAPQIVQTIPPYQEGDILLVPGQWNLFLPSLEAKVSQWVADAHPVWISLGFNAPPEVVSWWNQQLEPHGFAFLDGLVCEPVLTSAGASVGSPECGRLEIQPTSLSAQHPATRFLTSRNRSYLFAGVRPLDFRGGSNEYTRAPLVRTRTKAWVENPEHPDFQPSGQEARGIQNLAMAASRWDPQHTSPGRLIAAGTTLLFQQDHFPFSKDFLAATLRWLAQGKEGDVGLVPVAALPFRPSRVEKIRMANVAILGIPGFAFLLALIVFLRRRQ